MEAIINNGELHGRYLRHKLSGGNTCLHSFFSALLSAGPVVRIVRDDSCFRQRKAVTDRNRCNGREIEREGGGCVGETVHRELLPFFQCLSEN